MSPRAACRLERLGFDRVYDYTAGIADWKAAGLPVEGDAAPAQRVGDATRPDVPTCEPHEPIADVQERTARAGWDECIVVDCERVVVGRLRGRAWQTEPGTTAGDVMEAGPTTVRADGLLAPLVERMSRRGTSLVVVSTPQGELLGVVLRAEAERVLTGEPAARIWRDCEGCPGVWAAPPSPSA